MKDQLKLLEELQRHDARLQELDGSRKAIPERLDSMRKDLAKVEDLLARAKADLAETEKWRREKDDELKSQASLLEKSKQKATGINKQKEFLAAQKEVEALRKLSTETTEKMSQIIEASKKAEERISAQTSDVDKLRQVVEREEAAAREKLSGIDSEMNRERVLREEAAKRVRPDVLKKYGAIKMRRGLAVVAVHAGTCRGCNMNIPPQLFNILQRANSIEFCPNCNRIVYWDKLLEDPDGQPSEKA